MARRDGLAISSPSSHLAESRYNGSGDGRKGRVSVRSPRREEAASSPKETHGLESQVQKR